MRFRPCIDIHNGKVKQIVGSSLQDAGDSAAENYVSDADAAYYARLYKDNQYDGGHVIILNSRDSEYYRSSKAQAMSAFAAYPGGMQAGGGIDDENASKFIDAGASHVIVTSFVFRDGMINADNINKLENAVGKDRIVLDISCKKKNGRYYVVTDRWQKFTDTELNVRLMYELAPHCSEFLVHAADAEGKQKGIERDIIPVLASSPIPVTYAGGIGSYADILTLKELGESKIDFTVGSALQIFGGSLDLNKISGII